jgi:hypothetical protein
LEARTTLIREKLEVRALSNERFEVGATLARIRL